MQQQQENAQQGNFFDPRTILAIVLVGLVWVGWQQYLASKYPEAYKRKGQVAKTENEKGNAEKPTAKLEKAGSAVASNNTLSENSDTYSAAPNTKPIPNVPEKTYSFNNEKWSLEISSQGMGFKSIYLNSYTDREDKPIKLSTDKGFLPYETNIVGRQAPLNFRIKQTDDVTFFGVAEVNGLRIEKTIRLKPETYSFDTDVVVKGASNNFSGVVTYVSKKVEDVETSLFMPAMNQQEFFVAHGSTTDREYLYTEGGIEPSAYAQVRLLSLAEHYFVLGLIDRSDVIPEAKFNFDVSSSIALTKMTHSMINRSNVFNVKYAGYIGPKDLDILTKVDPSLNELVDFGWFSWLARILFSILRWFFGIFGNWGLAIIALTILVRIFVLPFHMMSYKSMKAMQDIQPEIKAVREKYKDDQQQVQQETMAIMKEHKVNPVGGCLPMLLQFPVFIALYRVFGQSIDLYKAPFALWIGDLSLKDPFYILPVVMGVVFFFQTKLTPSTMEPAQQKIMMLMPVMFAFFMAGLPSALTLYMCVSTIFGFVQQMYVMKDRNKTAAVVAQAKA